MDTYKMVDGVVTFSNKDAAWEYFLWITGIVDASVQLPFGQVLGSTYGQYTYGQDDTGHYTVARPVTNPYTMADLQTAQLPTMTDLHAISRDAIDTNGYIADVVALVGNTAVGTHMAYTYMGRTRDGAKAELTRLTEEKALSMVNC